MAVLSVSSSVLFVVIFAAVSCDDLAPFAKKTKENIPKDTFQKVYGVNFKNANDVKKAVENGVPELGRELGVKLPEKAIKALANGAVQIKDKFTPEFLFRLYANPEDEVLRKAGILNDGNIDKLAKKYADIIKEKAKNVKKPDLVETIPAVAGALGKFLKYLGVDESVLKDVTEKVFEEVQNALNGKKN